MVVNMEEVDITNDHARLCLYKQGLMGSYMDYIIHFNTKQNCIETVINDTWLLVEELCNRYKHRVFKARLIAECEYYKVDEHQDIKATTSYHFASYHSELVHDAYTFYMRHMQKIAARMDTFHENGSNLLLNRIKHIHITLSFIK